MSQYGAHLAGFTRDHLLNLVIQRYLELNNNGNAVKYRIQEENDILVFKYVDASGETTIMTINSSGDLVLSGSISGSLSKIQDADDTTSIATETFAEKIVFKTNGLNRMFLSEDGRLGIGADILAPISGLQVKHDDGTHFHTSSVNVGDTYLRLGGGQFNQRKLAIVAEPTGSNGINKLHFCFNNVLDNSDADLTDSKLTIDETGNVGIGTTTPSTTLEVNGDLIVDTNTLFVDSSSNMIGIGTLTPAEKLNIYNGNLRMDFSNGFTNFKIDSLTNSAQLSFTVANTDLDSNNDKEWLRVDKWNGGGGKALANHIRFFNWDQATATTQTEVLTMNEGFVGIKATTPTIDLAIGDNDTGLNNEGGNLLGIYTGGVERVRIDSSGNIGIGTIPSTITHIMSSNTELRLQNTNTSAGRFNKITFFNNAGTKNMELGTFEDSTTFISNKANGAVSIETNATERMRIDSSGNVGIGENAPDTRLHIKRNYNGDTTIKVENTFNQDNSKCQIELLSSINQFLIGATAPTFVDDTANLIFQDSAFISAGANLSNIDIGAVSGNIRFFANSTTERMRVSSGGNLGIGNTAPSKKLSVVNSSGDGNAEIRGNSEGNDSILYLGTPFNTSAVNKTAIIAEGLSTFSRNNLHFCLNNTANNTTEASLSDSKMVITRDGLVGIALTSPNTKFEVGDGTGNATIRITDTRADYGNAVGVQLGRLDFFSKDTSLGGGAGGLTGTYWAESVNTTVAPDTQLVWFNYSNGSTAGQMILTNAGTTLNTTGIYGGISDIRIKEEITDANSQWDDIKNIRFVNYKLKKEKGKEKNNTKFLGVIADEIEQVSPSIVDFNESIKREYDDETIIGLKTVKLSLIYLKTAKAFQEAQLRIETLEEQIQTQNILINDLSKRLEKLEKPI